MVTTNPQKNFFFPFLFFSFLAYKSPIANAPAYH